MELLIFGLIICSITFVKSEFLPQATQRKCPGDEATSRFEFENTGKIVTRYWYYQSEITDRNVQRELMAYHTEQENFVVMPDTKFNGKLKWINGTINIEIKNLTEKYTGMITLDLTILDQGQKDTKGNQSTSFILNVIDPCVKAKVVGPNVELTCVSGVDNPQYSWQGGDAVGKTQETISTKKSSNYTCCVDAAKNQCASVPVSADEVNGGNQNGSNIGMVVGIVVMVAAAAVVV